MFKVVAAAVLLATVSAVEFRFVNEEKGPLWIGIQGNPNHPHLNNGGFVLEQNQAVTVQAPEDWAGRFWARTWCDGGSNHCLTGDCGNRLECAGAGGTPPVTLAEITLKGVGGLNYYDISLVDGFNVPVTMEPVGVPRNGGQYSCTRAACKANINSECPDELKLNSEHGVVGCMSACSAFNTDLYCCRGEHGTPETCKASDWPDNYPSFFKNRCFDAYSYTFDDDKSTFTCKAENYIVTFG